jgi:hypothetical protein
MQGRSGDGSAAGQQSSAPNGVARHHGGTIVGVALTIVAGALIAALVWLPRRLRS